MIPTTIGEMLAYNARFRAECDALLPSRQADLSEVRAWVREGVVLPEGVEETAFRVEILEHSVTCLTRGWF